MEFADDIEADLLFKGIDLFDWYQGQMSSRRLLLLIKRLPEDGAFKTAWNERLPEDGAAWNWPLLAQLTAGAWNEIKAMRGDLWAFLGQETLTYKPVLQPSAVLEQEAETKAMRDMHDETMAQLRGG
jgi:hypothetical protein